MRARRRFLIKAVLVLCVVCWILERSVPLLWPAEGESAEVRSLERPHLEAVAVKGLEQYVFREDFSFPQPRVMKDLEELKSVWWMKNLQHYLRALTGETKQIYLLTSNYQYVDVLLNWLISAVVRCNISIPSILTLSLDYSTHTTLERRGFRSLFVPYDRLFKPNFTTSAPFEKVMMLRLSLMRLINHFGFDVVMVDTDAIMLRDPQPLFDALGGADIVGSVGTIPDDLFVEWGVTICIGVVLVRSSERTEEYWNSMKAIHGECLDDQGKLNYGLKALNVQWHNTDSSHLNTTIYGKASNHLQVSILPYKDVCRLTACDVKMRSRYYFWHKGGHRSRREKLHAAREGNTWFLRYKWNEITNSHIGKEWLRSIAYLGATVS